MLDFSTSLPFTLITLKIENLLMLSGTQTLSVPRRIVYYDARRLCACIYRIRLLLSVSPYDTESGLYVFLTFCFISFLTDKDINNVHHSFW